MSQKLAELSGGLPSLTFCNVAWNRNRHTAELTRHPVHLLFRKRARNPVHLCNKVHCLLPYDELPI